MIYSVLKGFHDFLCFKTAKKIENIHLGDQNPNYSGLGVFL